MKPTDTTLKKGLERSGFFYGTPRPGNVKAAAANIFIPKKIGHGRGWQRSADWRRLADDIKPA